MKKLITGLLYPVVLALGSCQSSQPSGDQLREVTVLYTNDEHGWMEGMQPGQGAANLYQLWRDREGYTEDGPFLVLSGGDNFTGPAISTWVLGESMVEVMNAMHYDASAVGNHEFDFGLDALKQRTAEAHYPYLSANTRWRATGRVPEDIGILPYTTVRVNGLVIGIIGLTTTETAVTTNPRYVGDLEFMDYEPVLRETIAEMGAAGKHPNLLFVISHICMNELEPLIKKTRDLHIALAGGGHCNELVAEKIGDTVVLEGGYHFTSYARATLIYDEAGKRVVSTDYVTRTNKDSAANSGVAGVVGKWADAAGDSLHEVIGSNPQTVSRGGPLEQLIIDSWLMAWPAADIAVTNMGGIRTDLPAGEITLGDLVNIMPFDNTIVSVEVPGRVVVEALRTGSRPVTAGLRKEGRRWLLTRTGEALQPERRYTVLINSFMYAGGDNYQAFATADPNGFDTGMHYRQPFLDWLKNRNASEDRALRR